MNHQPKEKPIVELLQDIHSQGNPRAPRGLIKPKIVDRITFLTTCVSIVLISVAFLGVIWEAVDPGIALRCIASLCVLLVAMHIFRAINEQYD